MITAEVFQEFAASRVYFTRITVLNYQHGKTEVFLTATRVFISAA